MPTDDTVSQPNTAVKRQSSISNAENVKKAEEYFGTTYKISEAGYLLTDGRLLDFSGKHEGGPGGYRSVDHRDIVDALDEDYGGDSYSGGMIRFMQEGNIRLSPESGGINLSVKPNKAQMMTLDRFITSFRGEVILDIDNADGNTVVSVEYPARTYSKRELNDITAYFEEGKIPESPSTLGQFRYSLSAAEADKQYMAAVEHADMDTAQRMVDEAARRAGFPEKLYHGTMRGFGFTKIDPNKARDKMSFFATDSPEVASTYSGDDGVMNISLAQELGLTAGNYQLYANTEDFAEIGAREAMVFVEDFRPYPVWVITNRPQALPLGELSAQLTERAIAAFATQSII